MVVFFAAGEASAEAVDVFLVVELFLVVDVPWVVVAVEAPVGASFFWAVVFLQELSSASVASAVIRVTRDVFIGIS